MRHLGTTLRRLLSRLGKLQRASGLAKPSRDKLFRRPRAEIEIEATYRLICHVLLLLAFLVVALMMLVRAATMHTNVPHVNATLTLLGQTITVKIPYPLVEPSFVTAITLTLTLFVLPVALLEYRRHRLLSRIEEQLPTVVRIIADILRTGGTLDKALEIVARSGLKPINKVFAQVLALSRFRAVPIVDAIREVGTRIGSLDLVRLADVLELASRYGAHAEDMLDLTSRTLEALQAFKRERTTHVRPYVVLVYIIVFVYIFICDLVALMSAGTLTPEQIPRVSPVKIYTLLGLEQYMLLTQLLTASLLIGRVLYERPLCGLIHFVILAPSSLAMNYLMVEVLAKLLLAA